MISTFIPRFKSSSLQCTETKVNSIPIISIRIVEILSYILTLVAFIIIIRQILINPATGFGACHFRLPLTI